MYKHQHHNMSDKSVQLIHQDTCINMSLPTLPARQPLLQAHKCWHHCGNLLLS